MIWFKWICDNAGREVIAFSRDPDHCPLKLPVIKCEKCKGDGTLYMI